MVQQVLVVLSLVHWGEDSWGDLLILFLKSRCHTYCCTTINSCSEFMMTNSSNTSEYLFAYMLVSVVKSFSLYFPHVQPVPLALLIFVTSIPFPLWVTEWTSPSCLACAAAVVCFLSFCPWFSWVFFCQRWESPCLCWGNTFERSLMEWREKYLSVKTVWPTKLD